MAKTQFDPRVYDARHLARVGVGGAVPATQRYYAISGSRRIIVFDLRYRLALALDSGDLGARPLALTQSGNFLFAMLETGWLVCFALIDPESGLTYRLRDDGDNLINQASEFRVYGEAMNEGRVLNEAWRIDVKSRSNDWILSATTTAIASEFRIRNGGNRLVSDVPAYRARISATRCVVHPVGAGGIRATGEGSAPVILSELHGFLDKIEAAAYDSLSGRIYCFNNAGSLAILSLSAGGILDLVDIQELPLNQSQIAPYGPTPVRLVALACRPYRRVYFLDVTIPDAPVVRSVSDYNANPDPGADPIMALNYVGYPLVQEEPEGGDSFLTDTNWPVTSAIDAKGPVSFADANQRVYAHGGIAAISFPETP